MPFTPDLPIHSFARNQILAIPPNIAGVYGIFNYNGLASFSAAPTPSWTWLYVGSSGHDVRGRLLDHLDGRGAPYLWQYADSSAYFVFEDWPKDRFSASPLLQREYQLIFDYQPVFNTQGRSGIPPVEANDIFNALLRGLFCQSDSSLGCQ
jgi:hypothetical protein